MAITVQHGKEESTTHADAIKWHIDETEVLHIIGPNGKIASYNRGYWGNVGHADPAKVHQGGAWHQGVTGP